MKLVHILARELRAWPEGVEAIEQDRKATLLYEVRGPSLNALYVQEHADDAEFAKVTREQWQAAVDALSAAKPTEWTGEDGSLPPVGTVCEYKSYHRSGEWKQVEIIAHFRSEAMVAAYIPTGDGVKTVGQAFAECFRPILTAEQIAAEERESRIKEIVELIGATTRSLGAIANDDWMLARALYDAGYRKQVQP